MQNVCNVVKIKFAFILQVADIEEKLDILIKAYMQDRERFISFPIVPDAQHSINPKNPPPDPPPGGGGGIKTSSQTTTSSLMVTITIFFYF